MKSDENMTVFKNCVPSMDKVIQNVNGQVNPQKKHMQTMTLHIPHQPLTSQTAINLQIPRVKTIQNFFVPLSPRVCFIQFFFFDKKCFYPN